MAEERKGEGESVATYWGRLLAECQVAPCEIADRHGDVVAVMVSYDQWLSDQWWMMSHANLDMLIDMPEGWTPDVAWDDIVWPSDG